MNPKTLPAAVLMPEYEALWNYRNYEKGIEKFMTNLQKRREELLALK